MPNQYNGNPNTTATHMPGGVAILSSTNANPIALTTSGVHGLTSGDKVDVSGHQVNTPANGLWSATVVSATVFTVPAAGSGVGGATGTVQSLACGPTAPLVSDGDGFNASAIDTPLTAALDRTAFLAQAAPFVKLAGRTVMNFPVVNGTAWATYNATIAAATWTVLPSTNPFNSQLVLQGATSAIALSAPFGVAGIAIGDIVRVALRANATSNANNVRVGLFFSLQAPGTVPSAFPTGWGQIPAMSTNITTVGENTFNMDGYIVAPFSGVLYLQPALYYIAGGAIIVTIENDSLLTVETFRPTGMPQ